MSAEVGTIAPGVKNRRRILVISADIVGPKMAGVGIRATEFARQLAPHGDVTLAAVPGSVNPLPELQFVEYRHGDPKALLPLIKTADVVVCQPTWPKMMGWLRNSDARLIFDMYVPEIFEVLESFKGRSRPMRELVGAMITDRALAAFHIGHHFVCASETQRDMWLGAMMAERLVRFGAYQRDSTFRSVIEVVPFGIPDAAPTPPRTPAIRSRFPAIADHDEIVLWNGGVWGWLDPLGPIRAVAELAERRPTVRLVFMGAATHTAAIRATETAMSLARELAVLDSHVFFNDQWVPYESRGDWLIEADCAVSSHTEHLETRFAFRTRLLDCFWSRLPIVCTRGDDLAGLVERDRLGVTVAPRDPSLLAAALESVLREGRDAYRPGLDAAAEHHRWSRVCEPLVRFALDERPAVTLNASLAARASIRASQRLRGIGYRVARTTLNHVGLEDWPSQGMG